MTEALVSYASSGDDANVKGDTSDDSYFVGSDDESVDSAKARRMEAERRLRDADEISTGPANNLPDPLSALGQIRHAPSYLTPEATRPLAAPAHRSRLAQTAPAQAEILERDKNVSPSTWDIARMAPPLKGQTHASKRGLPAGAVLSAAAKRYKPEDDAAGGITTAAQIAMLGGQWRPSADEDSEPAANGPIVPGGQRDGMQGRKGPTKAMPVSEFMDKGIGGAALPRRKQDRKDKEKSKRALGQSAIGSWKTEAEMVLRQQYDS